MALSSAGVSFVSVGKPAPPSPTMPAARAIARISPLFMP